MRGRYESRGSSLGDADSTRAGEGGVDHCFGSRRSPVQVRAPRPDQNYQGLRTIARAEIPLEKQKYTRMW